MNTYLDTINNPQDIKNLTLRQMKKLAEEIREFLIKTVSETGGHLSSNLGAVELTLALHKVFNSPYDKIIFDVGHQSYTHKILTGRRGDFHTLRQFGGLSGFPKPSESKHDAFGTGHSSTSISAALGMALARDLDNKKNKIIAVIGDGSLTGGQAFEALNHAGHLKRDLVVILNDNEMSIAKNVGALSDYLSKIRTDPTYSRVKGDLERWMQRIPSIGDSVYKSLTKVKDSIKYVLMPGALFEEFGFTYFGPIDGHNLASLVEIFQKIKYMPGPIFIHVNTIKGKGYSPAEVSSDKFHGIGPFYIETGESSQKKSDTKTYTQVFGDTLIEIGENNSNVVAITAAMPEGTGLDKFSKKFPERFFDVGIAEQHAITMASGLSIRGKLPVIVIYSTFVQRAYDHILHDACLQKLPMIIALDRAGIVGEDGDTHQGIFDYSFLRHIPNITVAAPKDENELRNLLYSASLQLNGPIAIRYPRGFGLGVEIPDVPTQLPLGKSENILEFEENNNSEIKLAFFAIGTMVNTSVQAAEVLRSEGINAAVINARFLKPLDSEMLDKLFSTATHLVTIEENTVVGGFGSAVLEYMNDSMPKHRPEVLRLGLPDKFVPHGSRNILLKENKLDKDSVVERVKEFILKKES